MSQLEKALLLSRNQDERRKESVIRMMVEKQLEILHEFMRVMDDAKRGTYASTAAVLDAAVKASSHGLYNSMQ